MARSAISFLRKVGLVEGISYLLLLGICMPMKYLLDMPLPVKIVGWAHGVLFVVLCLAILRAMLVAKFSFGRAVMVFIASLLPFGPFVIDKRMRQYEAEATTKP